MKFGEKIKKIRETFYLSQEQFSKIIDIPLCNVVDWENGSLEHLNEEIKKITDVFMLKEDDLTSKKRIKLHLMKVGIEHFIILY